MSFEIIGGIAGILCTVSFLPQVLKIFRARNAEDISLLTFSLFSAGVLLWFIYGLLIGNIPIAVTNAVIFVLALMIVFMKLKYR